MVESVARTVRTYSFKPLALSCAVASQAWQASQDDPALCHKWIVEPIGWRSSRGRSSQYLATADSRQGHGAALPVLRCLKCATAGVTRDGRGGSKPAAALKRYGCGLATIYGYCPKRFAWEDATQMGNLKIPVTELTYRCWLLVYGKPTSRSYRKSVVAGQRNIRLHEPQSAGVQIDLLPEQAPTQCRDRAASVDEFFVLGGNGHALCACWHQAQTEQQNCYEPCPPTRTYPWL